VQLDLDERIRTLRAPLGTLAGVGPARAAPLARHGLHTVGDLLYHLPFRYEDRRTLTPVGALSAGRTATTLVEILRVREGRTRRSGRAGRVVEAVARDDSGAVALVWFNQGAHMRTRVRAGTWAIVHGRVDPGPRLLHPEIETIETEPGARPRDGAIDAVRGLVPVYRRPGRIGAGIMRRLVRSALAAHGRALAGVLPGEVARRHDLIDLEQAVSYLHAPPIDADIEALNAGRTAAHRSLCFDEVLCLQIGLALRRAACVSEPGIAFPVPGGRMPALRARLPFRLTAAQERALGEIAGDMAERRPMHRLLQGDVGSGKTVVALLAALIAVDAGYQAAFMVPTEILAEQHAQTATRLLAPLGLEPASLTGSTGAASRRQAIERIGAGEPLLVIGTQAIVQHGVRFSRLGLAVIDEQHRFGVLERARLGGRGAKDETGGLRPDVLVMTATPIPRTLAMTVYGDLDVSSLDERPPGRRPVRTLVVGDGERGRVYAAVRDAVRGGGQAFVVLPLVEESDVLPLRAATALAGDLRRGALAGCRVGLVHGRMRPESREREMRTFRTRGYDVLVSTTVVEVGIDVPGASVMVVEDADRFGLAQLHQLRGRVGRGSAEAACYLVASRECSDAGYERLRVMETTDDGFRIGEADLRIRGPGEFLGTRQAGLPEFRVASLLRDAELLAAARAEASRLLAVAGDDPSQRAAHARTIFRHRWADRLGLAAVG
jgi:ATP-dependent DNA helicase RecG